LTHQVYALIFAMSIEAFLCAEKGQDGARRICLGIAGAMKVTPALLLPYFLLQRRWKLATTSLRRWHGLLALAWFPSWGCEAR